MNLGGGEVRAGVMAQGVGVVGVTVGQLPDAIVGGGLLAQLAQGGGEAIIGGIHGVFYLRQRGGGDGFLVGGADVVQFLQAAVEFGVEKALRGGLPGDAAHFRQHAVKNESGWNHAGIRAYPQSNDSLVEFDAYLRQTGNVILRVWQMP